MRFDAASDSIDDWEAPRPAHTRGVRPWLLVTLLVLFLAEVLATRLGWRQPALAWPGGGWRAVRLPAPTRPLPPRAEPRIVVEPEPAPPGAESETAAVERRTRFARAKRRTG